MNDRVRRLTPTKPQRDAIAFGLVTTLGVVAAVAVYATWKFAKLVP